MEDLTIAARERYSGYAATYYDAVAVHRGRWDQQLRTAQQALEGMKERASTRIHNWEKGDGECSCETSTKECKAQNPPNAGNALSGLLEKGFTVSNQSPRSTIKGILQ